MKPFCVFFIMLLFLLFLHYNARRSAMLEGQLSLRASCGKFFRLLLLYYFFLLLCTYRKSRQAKWSFILMQKKKRVVSRHRDGAKLTYCAVFPFVQPPVPFFTVSSIFLSLFISNFCIAASQFLHLRPGP